MRNPQNSIVSRKAYSSGLGLYVGEACGLVFGGVFLGFGYGVQGLCSRSSAPVACGVSGFGEFKAFGCHGLGFRVIGFRV